MINTSIEHAEKLSDWIKNRQGIAVWKSIDLSNPDVETYTPGDITEKPHWRYANSPSYIVTDPALVTLNLYKEYKRFHVAIRRGAQGYTFKLTDASSRKLRAACDKAGEKSTYHFDYGTQEAVIEIPAETITLKEWQEKNGH